jgi:Zn-dependent protease with chaperone function
LTKLKRKGPDILKIMGMLSIIAGIIVMILTVIEFINHNQSLGSTGIGIALGVILIAMGFIPRHE